MMKANTLFLIALVALVTFVFGATTFSPTTVTTVSSPEEGTATITYKAVQCTYIQRAGESEYELWDCNPNLFNADGMNATMERLFTVSPATASSAWQVNAIAIANKSSVGNNCNADQQPEDTFLCGEYTHSGLARLAADATKRNVTDGKTAGNWTITAQFTNTGSGALGVNATGLFNTTTANQSGEVFFAQNTFTTATLQVNDKINVTWFIWVV